MFTLDGVRKLHGWTHASLNLLLNHLSTMPTDDYVKQLSGFGFPTLREQTIHISTAKDFGFTPSRAYSTPTGPLRTAHSSPMQASCRRTSSTRPTPICRP